MPAGWNGELVIWNHEFTLSPPGPVSHAGLGPLADLQLAEGYAVAASSYRLSDWAVFETNTDLKNLYDVFRRTVGAPAQVILVGASLGGVVTIEVLEQGNVGYVAGALTMCGALAGSRNWDGALDIRLVYDAVCAGVPGAAIPGGAEGLPKNSTFSQTDSRPLSARVSRRRCPGLRALSVPRGHEDPGGVHRDRHGLRDVRHE